MGHYLLLLLLVFTSSKTFSQDTTALPTQDGKILIQQIISLADTTTKKDRIYVAAKEWISNSFKSSKAVIDLDDKEAGKIICKSTYRSEKKNNDVLVINFTLNITTKDGKYRIQIYDLTGKEEHYDVFKDQLNSFYPFTDIDFEKMNNEYISNPKKPYYKRKYDIDILGKTNSAFKKIIADIQVSVDKNLTGLNNDDF